MRLNNEIELYGQKQQVEKLTQKCMDQSMQIASLKKEVAYLQKINKELESNNEMLQHQVLQNHGAANVTVNIY